MRTTWLWLGIVLLVALPASAGAQHQRGESSRGLNGAVEKLSRHREELGMTAGQLARVQEIKDSADARNRPYWRQIMEIRRDVKARQKAQPGMPEAEKAALLDQSGEEIRRLLDEIKRVEHAAMRDIGSVLNPHQRDILREMIGRNKDERGRHEESGERGDRRH